MAQSKVSSAGTCWKLNSGWIFKPGFFLLLVAEKELLSDKNEHLHKKTAPHAPFLYRPQALKLQDAFSTHPEFHAVMQYLPGLLQVLAPPLAYGAFCSSL